MWIDRRIGPRILALADTRPAVLLTGARQTGKTSLLRRLFPDHTFVSLDRPADAALADEDPRTFLLRHPAPVVIDEVQYAPKLFRHIKAEIDALRDAPGRFILTGSQKFLLMQGVSDSLAGRVGVVELEPLSWHEVRAIPNPPSPEGFLLRGGLPELWADRRIDAPEFHRAYLTTWLERDVRSLHAVGSLRDFDRFVRACALRSGQVLNRADLGRDVGVTGPTVSAWLSVLEACKQLTMWEPWFRNATKSLTKAPKIYWCDGGFLAWILGVRTEEELERSPLKGAIWESFVATELQKRLSFGGQDGPHFYRDRTLEADVLLHRGGLFELMDAKWSRTPTARDAATLDAVGAALGADRVLARRLICRTDASHTVGSATAVGLDDPWFEGDLDVVPRRCTS